MQDLIDDIMFDKYLSKKEKIEKLKNLFLEEKIKYFSDFDDTISNNNCVFYTKVKILKKFNKFNRENQENILKTFSLNDKFPEVNEKIIIISRNNHEFLKSFLKKNKKFLEKKWINISWVIWQKENFLFSSKEKLKFLWKNSYFIWDEFEDKILKTNEKFILVDKLGFFRKIIIKIKKIFILVIFIIKWF